MNGTWQEIGRGVQSPIPPCLAGFNAARAKCAASRPLANKGRPLQPMISPHSDGWMLDGQVIMTPALIRCKESGEPAQRKYVTIGPKYAVE